MKNVAFYCGADCEYKTMRDGYGVCTHPRLSNMAQYGGIDRYYIEKCPLLKIRSIEKDGENNV